MSVERTARDGRQPIRHSVVPDAAGRSLWLSAVWTGVGVAVVGAILSVLAVAVCWLPVSGNATGNRGIETVKAGLLTFLAALHGGVTVDGSAATWLPLGMVLLVALIAWRAGSGLADAAFALDERDPVRLWLAGIAQAAAFGACCLVAVPLASVGTSRAPFLGVGIASLLLFLVSGTVAFVRSSPLREWCAERLPASGPGIVRCAAAALAVYLAGGALLVAAALSAHHEQVSTISRNVGSGWGGLPVLILGVLAAPNAAIAAASYLAGPGFAVGAGTTVSVTTTATGVLPAFPLLGALPTGHGPNAAVWVLVIATPLLAAAAVARLANCAGTWRRRLLHAGGAALLSGVVMAALAWQGGGAVGDGRLHTIGASAWQLGGSVAAEVAVLSLTWLALGAAWTWLRRPVDDADEVGFFLTSKPAAKPASKPASKPESIEPEPTVQLVTSQDEADQLAG